MIKSSVNIIFRIFLLVFLCTNLHAVEKPQYTDLPCPSFAEIEQGLLTWQQNHPNIFQVTAAGKTPEGNNIVLCKITDFSVADENKQVVLLTTCHAATEKNGVTSILHFTKFLLSDDAAAEEIRKQQIILVMPCNDPEGYKQGKRVRDIYYDGWDWNGISDPAQYPEAAVLQKVIEKYQPEVHVDLHGFSKKEQTMWESTGISWTGGFSRSFNPEIPKLMNEAAEKAGFLITEGEKSDGKLLATGPVSGADEHFYLRGGHVIPPAYSYHYAHTIGMTMEIGFEESAVVRLKRLVELGHQVWRGERYPGYPVNQVGCRGSMAVSAWGRTAAERRASRVELWQKAGQIAYSIAWPEPRGSMMAFFASDPAETPKIIGDRKLETMAENLSKKPGYNVKSIQEFIKTIPAYLVGKLEFLTETVNDPVIKNGLVLRLLIPYPDAEPTHLCLDGYEISKSDYFGYKIYHNPGTIVEISIPPEKTKPFHVVTCAYETATKRRAGFDPEDW